MSTRDDTPDAAAGPTVRDQPIKLGGQGALGPFVERFDRWADARIEPLRSNATAVRVFTSASKLGEFSLVWQLVNVLRAVSSPRRRHQLPILAAALAAESLIVNQGIKRVFKRARPLAEGDPRYELRKPLTSSFPSGHASSAAFAATILTGWDGRRWAPVWWSLAGTVAVSRLFVRVHHASDVVAGLVVGRVLGRFARRVVG